MPLELSNRFVALADPDRIVILVGYLKSGQPKGFKHPDDKSTHTSVVAKSLLGLFTELGAQMTRDVLPVPLCSLILRAFKIRSCTPVRWPLLSIIICKILAE